MWDDVSTAAKIQFVIFWVAAPCSVLVRRFGGPCCLHLQRLWHRGTICWETQLHTEDGDSMTFRNACILPPTLHGVQQPRRPRLENFTAVKNVHLPLVLNFHCSSNKDTFLMVVLWFSVTLYLIQYNPVVLHVPSLLTLHPNLRTYLFSPPSSFHTCSSFLWNGNFFPTWNVRNYDIQQN